MSDPDPAAPATVAPDAAAPLLRIVRGAPDGADVDVAIAALLAVLAARSGPAEAPPARLSAWNSPSALLRGPVVARRGGWWAAGLPH